MKAQIAIVLCAILCMNAATAATAYVWSGPDEGLWSQPGNWSPNGTPGTDPADTVQIIADPNISTAITADVSCTVQSITSSGKVLIRGTLDSTGYPENTLDSLITSSGFLDIWNMTINGQIVNQAGALMKLREIRGAVIVDNYGDLRWYFVNVLDEASFITNYNKMYVINPGVLDSYGSMMNTGMVSISFSTLAFEAGASLVNEGMVYGAGSLMMMDAPLSNSGTIKSMFGDLLVVSTGETTNNGTLYNEPGTLLFMTTQAVTPLVNHGQIRTLSGGGVSLYPSQVSNESGGLIELIGGFLRAWNIEAKAYSTIQGRGELISSLSIDPDAAANFYRDLTITNTLTINPSAELTLSDGELLAEGGISNEGTIRLKSSRLIPRGGITGIGLIIWDISDYNTMTDYNFDGTVNMEDLATFSQTWLWQSPL
jgi:hypothetical protein